MPTLALLFQLLVLKLVVLQLLVSDDKSQIVGCIARRGSLGVSCFVAKDLAAFGLSHRSVDDWTEPQGKVLYFVRSLLQVYTFVLMECVPNVFSNLKAKSL